MENIIKEMQQEKYRILPASESCSMAICMAADLSYLPYAAVTIHSILRHGSPDRYYDILLLSRDMTKEKRSKLEAVLGKYPNASLRIVDMQVWETLFSVQLSSYYTVETYYRLMLLSDIFSQYKRLVYVDCDLIVRRDILELEDVDMKGYPLAACRDYSVQLKQNSKGAVFMDNQPYSVENYCREQLGIEEYENYFNAGVLMFDADSCRQHQISVENAIKKMQEKKWYYNDQDVLNMLFDGKVHYLDTGWNYLFDYEKYVSYPHAAMTNLYQKAYREKPAIIHYISGRKPWNYSPLVLEHLFWEEVRSLEKEVPAWQGNYPRPEREKKQHRSLYLNTKQIRKTNRTRKW